MRIGFLNNQIDNRGTGNAVFDYAHYNEEILGNKSVILTYPDGAHNKDAVLRYQRRFGNIYTMTKNLDLVDVLYHIKSGHNDGFRTPNSIPYLVHSVFEMDAHGERYATISRWMGERFGIPFVPHIVELPDIMDNLRGDIGIPKNAVVFGRHGGPDSFDISWAWNAVSRVLQEKPNVWFLFMNTNKPDIELNKRCVFVEPSVNPYHKRAFINSCDAMVHARSRGETFGIAVGEFALYGKPVITYSLSPEIAHITELQEYGLYYENEEELFDLLMNFRPMTLPPFYTEFTPEKVMNKFREVFLDGLDTRD